MGVVRVDLLCECEYGPCGKRFGVEVDLAINPRDHVDFESMVREVVNDGCTTAYTWGVRGKMTVDRFSLIHQVTIQGGMLLCDNCSKKCDDYPVEGNLTPSQVARALGGGDDHYE